jgi:hypothetical protein
MAAVKSQSLPLDLKVADAISLIRSANQQLLKHRQKVSLQAMVCIESRAAVAQFDEYLRSCGNYDADVSADARVQLIAALTESQSLLVSSRYWKSVTERIAYLKKQRRRTLAK